MESRSLLYPLRRWWWLILLALLFAAGTSYFISQYQQKTYKSKVTLMVGRVINNPNPDSRELMLSQQLASIYADMAGREPVQTAAKQVLGLEELPINNAYALPNSQLMEIVVTDSDPMRAMAVANELAIQLIEQSPSQMDEEGNEREEFITAQLDYLEKKINETKDAIQEKQIELAELMSAREISDMEDTIIALGTKLTTLQMNYAAMMSTPQLSAINTISIVEPATMPNRPTNPDVR